MIRSRKYRQPDWVPPDERSNASPDVSHFKAALEAEMAAYDRLPRDIAQWLDEAPKKYSAVQIEELVNAGYALSGGQLQPARRASSAARYWWRS